MWLSSQNLGSERQNEPRIALPKTATADEHEYTASASDR